jgi:glutathione peroxidase
MKQFRVYLIFTWLLLGALALSGNPGLALAFIGEGPSSVLDFSLVSLDGKSAPLKQYAGKVLLIVNLATKSKFADQIPKLETLYEKYEAQGLLILGVPSNDFGAGEPEKDTEVAAAYATYKLKFPLFGKSTVTGHDQLPLFKYLTTPPKKSGEGEEEGSKKAWPTAGEVPWNFTKYLIDRQGKPLARFDADVAPDSVDLMSAIEQALEAKPKPETATPSKAKSSSTASSLNTSAKRQGA